MASELCNCVWWMEMLWYGESNHLFFFFHPLRFRFLLSPLPWLGFAQSFWDKLSSHFQDLKPYLRSLKSLSHERNLHFFSPSPPPLPPTLLLLLPARARSTMWHCQTMNWWRSARWTLTRRRGLEVNTATRERRLFVSSTSLLALLLRSVFNPTSFRIIVGEPINWQSVLRITTRIRVIIALHDGNLGTWNATM